MRILLLTAVILISYYVFSPSGEERPEIDAIKMRVWAPTRKAKVPPKKAPVATAVPESEVLEAEAIEEHPADEVPEEFQEGEGELAHVEEEAPPADHERGWHDELGQLLSYLEPEYGEEIFNAYVSERNNFQASLDELIRSNQKNQDLDLLITELENKHEERIKEIMGRHYEEIKEMEAKFLESTTP